jgi:competence protein ComGC
MFGFDSKIRIISKIGIIKIVALLLLVLVPALLAQKTSGTQTSTATVRVQTSLVVVPAIITDRQGNPVEDLGKNDFILKEDGKPQTQRRRQAAEHQRI